MQKKILIAVLAISTSSIAYTQDLDAFNTERLDLTKKGMVVLGSWAVANIALSPVFVNNSSGSEKYFHQMNGYWNVVNLLVAGLGYYSATKTNPDGLTAGESLKEQQKLEKTLLFNAGLDIAYVVGGLYLRERSENTNDNPDRLEGFGQSLILQGAFLFVFDIVFYLAQRCHGLKLFGLVDNLALSPTGFKLTWKL